VLPAANNGSTFIDDAADGDDKPGISKIENLPPDREEYTLSGLRPSTSYIFRIRAKNDAGEVSGWSTPIVEEGTTAAATGTPDAPTLMVPGPTDTGTVAVSWTKPAGEGTTPITGYELQFVRDKDSVDDNDVDYTDATTVLFDSPSARSYDHKNVEGGVDVAWVYRLRAVNGSGGGEWADMRILVPARAPNAPVLTGRAISPTEILLEWTVPFANATDIHGYDIRKWDVNSFGTDDLLLDADDTADTTSFTVGSLTGGEEYFFIVRAENDANTNHGVWSSGSLSLPATTEGAFSITTPTGVPGRPGLTAATAGEATDAAGSVNLTLTPTTADGGSDIVRYELQIWYDGKWNEAADLEDETDPQLIEDLTPGQRYYFATRAHNATGAGPWSDLADAMAKADAPDAPVLSLKAASGDSITLTWTVPEANGSVITSYQIHVSNPDNTSWVETDLLVNTIALLTEFTHPGRASGKESYYRIRAMTSAPDDGPWSTGETTNPKAEGFLAKTLGDTPNKVVLSTVVPDVDGVGNMPAPTLTVSWARLSSSNGDQTGGSEIMGYDIQIWDGASQQWVDEDSVAATEISYEDTGLTGGDTHYYRVRARNSGGPGPWSVYLGGTVAAQSPDAPVLTAKATGIDEVRVTWTIPNGNGTNVTGYNLQRWNTDPVAGATTADWSMDLLPELVDAGDLTLYVDRRPADPTTTSASTLEPGTTYYYRIQATGDNVETNNDNPGNSAYSAIASVSTIADAPGRPVLTAVADGKDAIDLTWTAPASGGNAIVRYELERWDVSTTRWVSVNNALSAISTSYEHPDLAPGTRNIYRLRAVNRAPTNNGVGLWSTIASATTDAAE
jgi:hypothetical protein